MGDSRYTSNILAGGSAVTISGFSSLSATNITVSGTLTNPAPAVTSYIKLGSHQYILFGSAVLATTAAKTATAVDASCQGSLYFSSGGKLYIMSSDTVASSFPY